MSDPFVEPLPITKLSLQTVAPPQTTLIPGVVYDPNKSGPGVGGWVSKAISLTLIAQSFIPGAVPGVDAGRFLISNGVSLPPVYLGAGTLNVTPDGILTVGGVNAAYVFQDRTSGAAKAFQWFANAGTAYLFSTETLGAALSVDKNSLVAAKSYFAGPDYNQSGINIVKTTPSSVGALPGALYDNTFQNTIDTEVQARIDPRTGQPGLPGTPYAANWIGTQFTGYVGSSYNATGMADVGQAFTIGIGLNTLGNNTTTSDLSTGSFGYSNNYLVPNARGYGLTVSSSIGPDGTQKEIIGIEVAASIGNGAGGAVGQRRALNLLSYDIHTATGLDAAIFVQPGNPGGQFKNFMALAQTGGNPALQTTGSIIYDGGFAQTIGNILNIPLLDVSNFIINAKYTKLSSSVLALGTSVQLGGLSLDGPAATAIFGTLKQNGVANFTFGLTTGGNFAVGNALTTTNPIVVDKTTSITTINNGMSVNGAFALGASTLALTGSLSLPAVVQGDIWFGSTTANTVAALAKNATASRYLSNQGASNGPAWSQVNLANGVSGLLAAVNGGLGVDASSAAGIPLWTAGVPTFTSTSGTGNIARVSSPTFTTPTLGAASATSINSVILDENAFGTAFTPVTGSTGTPPTTATATCRWRRLLGRAIIAKFRYTISTLGSPTGHPTVTLPVNADVNTPLSVLFGRESATTGKGVAGAINSATTVFFAFTDSASVFAGGLVIVDFTVIYESAT